MMELLGTMPRKVRLFHVLCELKENKKSEKTIHDSLSFDSAKKYFRLHWAVAVPGISSIDMEI